MSYARQTSLPFAVLTCSLALVLGGIFWGIIDTAILGNLLETEQWQTGSQAAMLSRRYILDAWTWLPLVLLLRLGLEIIITSRQVSSSPAVLGGVVALIFTHLVLLLWGITFASAIDPMLTMGLEDPTIASVGYDSTLLLVRDVAFAYIPGIVAVCADLWFLSSPIRNDAVGGYV